MSEALRKNHLAAAGYNVLRLSPSAVRFDLLTDVPHGVLVPDGHRTTDVDPDSVSAAFIPLTADARLAIGTKGRAAEHALVEALGFSGPPVVLTHGLFTTTMQALAKRGAVIEELRAARDGSADVDLDQLEQRLARGGVHLVYLELANNAWFGWPLSEANVAGVRAACDRHGAKLLLDAARPLANSFALGQTDAVACARRILTLADAFTMSCAKELLVPTGSIVGSRDAALIARAWEALFKAGTSLSAIDPPQARADLRDGARYVLQQPALVADRTALACRLATALVEAGVSAVQPVTAHAVYVPIDRALLAGEVPALIGLLDHLYVLAGVRAQVSTTKKGPAIRLAVPLCTVLNDDDLREIVRGFVAFLSRIDERPKLLPIEDQVDVPYFRRFTAS